MDLSPPRYPGPCPVKVCLAEGVSTHLCGHCVPVCMCMCMGARVRTCVCSGLCVHASVLSASPHALGGGVVPTPHVWRLCQIP